MRQFLLIPVLVCLFLGTAIPAPVNTRVIILPFQVISPEKKDHQWLGRAISYFLTKGMDINSIEAIPDNRIYSLLDSHNINFPYPMSKASGIKLSIQAGADTIVWGEVLPPEEPESEEVQVRGYIIDLKRQSQKYLPLIKFNIKDMFTFHGELLVMVLKHFQKSEEIIPELSLDHHGYETFIKSLLLTDPREKIKLLLDAYPNNNGSELITLELAKCYLVSGNLEKTGFYLEVQPGSELLKNERLVLNALLCLGRGNRQNARKIFSDLLEQKKFVTEASNNLGVILFQEADFEQAHNYFLRSLRENRDPEVFCNYIHSLIKSVQVDKAKATLNTALSSFPDDENLIKLFSYFVSRDPHRHQLVTVFRKYVPEMDTPVSELPETIMHIKNPFVIQSCENLSALMDSEKVMKLLRQGNRIAAIKTSEQLMEINPFIPRLHRALQEIYRKQKNARLAACYSLSAAYLENQNSF